MHPSEFVYRQVSLLCIKAGADPDRADRFAQTAKDKYLRNQFRTPSKLIEETIKDCKKEIKHAQRRL